MKITIEVRCKWGSFTSAPTEVDQEGLKKAGETLEKINELSYLSLNISNTTVIYLPKPVLQDSILILKVEE